MDPIETKNNHYIQIVSDLLAQRHEVISIEQGFKRAFKLKRSNTAAILNWFESKVSHSRVPVAGFIKCVVMLLGLKLICSGIVWVKHNHQPHDAKSKLTLLLSRWLEALMSRVCTEIITHDTVPNLNSKVVPHPLYLRHPLKTEQPNRDIDFLIFGQVKRYKNLTALLNVWPTTVPLYLVGKSESDTLTKELNKVIEDRSLYVKWDNRFIPDDELNTLLQRTKFAIFPHSEDSMIVSGAFYHAISYGCNVLMSDNAFGRNMTEQHKFSQLIDINNSLDLQLVDIRNTLVEAEKIIDEVFIKYADTQVTYGFEQALSR